MLRALRVFLVLLAAGAVADSAGAAVRVLFVGNSFFYGAVSAAEHYRPQSVRDLNGSGYGGVPALFKRFAEESGIEADVALETVPGVGFDEHYEHRRDRLDAPWDEVIMSTYSTLDQHHPGDPAMLLQYTPRLVDLFAARNPAVHVYLNATWTRADQTYLPEGHWAGRGVEAMAEDVQAGYEAAQRAEPRIRAVIATGAAWTRAMRDGIADSNPYDGIDAHKVDLWATDHYHASVAGYYLEALMIFGAVTGRDPVSLGAAEEAAHDLGLAPDLTLALQQVAHAQLQAR
jgi:hypothetical protein